MGSKKTRAKAQKEQQREKARETNGPEASTHLTVAIPPSTISLIHKYLTSSNAKDISTEPTSPLRWGHELKPRWDVDIGPAFSSDSQDNYWGLNLDLKYPATSENRAYRSIFIDRITVYQIGVRLMRVGQWLTFTSPHRTDREQRHKVQSVTSALRELLEDIFGEFCSKLLGRMHDVDCNGKLFSQESYDAKPL
ncbi:hypothetical protein LTR08_002833 [Meristemomyces frigidus]|nr:hypothetical protein LTR08_002833 [Meristemomyces frigidus]